MLLRRVDGGWSAPSLRNYGSEDDLQRLLASSPDLIPGAARTATAREFQVRGVGALDIICISAEGEITLVECKLASNAEIRRTVVGQLLAYASGIRGMSYDDFSTRFADRAEESLLSAVKAAAGRELEEEAFRYAVEKRLVEGAFTLVFAVDEITNELKAIVEFLHHHLSSDVPLVALELGYLKVATDEELLVPKTYGAELAAEKAADGSASAKKRWSSPEVTEALEHVDVEGVREFVQSLLKHAARYGASVQGGAGQSPSAGVYYPLAQKKPSLWSLWVDEGDARVALNLGSIANASPVTAAEVLELMRADKQLSAPLPDDDAEALKKYPVYAVSGLLASGSAPAFEALLDTALGIEMPPNV